MNRASLLRGPIKALISSEAEIEAVAGQHEVQAGRVTAPHLETVERPEGYVDGPQDAQSGGRSGAPAPAELTSRPSEVAEG